MERLWAPWRADFISGPKPTGCFLCEAAAAPASSDPEHLVVARTRMCLAILNRYPYNNGHLMVAPAAHLATLDQLEQETAVDMTLLTQRSLRVLREVLTPQAFNIGINMGKVAGAGIADHIHQHVVPRWDGDTNFMPVLADVKVMNDHLARSYATIREGYDRLA
jgi:ATP adenylyltransferase